MPESIGILLKKMLERGKDVRLCQQKLKIQQ